MDDKKMVKSECKEIMKERERERGKKKKDNKGCWK